MERLDEGNDVAVLTLSTIIEMVFLLLVSLKYELLHTINRI
jgi:hypothetical protein